MTLKIYNTLTKKKEEFKPIKKGQVGLYLCGPTVNGIPHLGHARVQIVFDTFRRYLKFLGYNVNFVSNITDIDDKIIKKAQEEKTTIQELTLRNTQEHIEQYGLLGVESPNTQPKATEYVKEMIELVNKLIKEKYTYTLEEDGIYYDVSKFKDYGKLSGINLNELKKSRELQDESKGIKKQDQKDFVIWKFSKEGEPSWDAPFGAGRPGWHIECSAMTHSILGNPFDIHAGGQDLIFPHHEDEIAQSEAGYKKKMCNYWMHNGMVNINKVKMSKSLGNYTTIKELLDYYPGPVIRYFILGVNYRKPIDFSKDKLNESKISYERLKRRVLELEEDKKENKLFMDEFKEIMNEDLNTPGAINLIWKILDYEGTGKKNTIYEIDKILGLKLFEKDKIILSEKVKKLLKERELARKKKEWKKSDELRERIREEGFLVKDSKDGQELEKI